MRLRSISQKNLRSIKSIDRRWVIIAGLCHSPYEGLESLLLYSVSKFICAADFYQIAFWIKYIEVPDTEWVGNRFAGRKGKS